MSHVRDSDRVVTALLCRFEEDGAVCDGNILDISRTGIGIDSYLPLKIGAKKQLQLIPTNLKLPAVVKWCVPANNSYRIGLVFEETAPEITDIVQRLGEVWKRFLPEN